MTYDPEFPDRPDSPDFWKLSAIVIEHDTLAEQTLGGAMERLLEYAGVDGDSLAYVAHQRTLRAVRMLPTKDPQRSAYASWIDGFLAGARWGLDRFQAPADGDNRKGVLDDDG